jgi:hypothetical protein
MKKLMGLFVSVALMGSGAALAGDDWKNKNKDQQTQSQGAAGGSGSVGQSGSTGQDIGGSGQSGQAGQSGQMGQGAQGQSGQVGQSDQGQSAQVGQSGMTGADQQLSGTQLSGRVVRSNKKMVWVEHAGAIVPLKIDKNTQFTDPNLKRAQDLKEGDEIRASFEVRKTDNVATSIQKSGMGGSGQDVMSPDPSINQSPGGTLPPSNDGTGGSGDLGSDIPQGTGSDIGTGSDVGSDIGTGSDVGSDTTNKPSGDF